MTSKRVPTLSRPTPKHSYVSIDEAAEMMSMSTVTIRRRISDGSIPAY